MALHETIIINAAAYSEHSWDQTKLGPSEHQIQISCNLTILCWQSRVLRWHSTILSRSSQPCSTHGPSTMLVQSINQSSLNNPKWGTEQRLKNMAETCMHMHTHKNTIKSTSVVLYKYTCCCCQERWTSWEHQHTENCDLSGIPIWPLPIVNSSNGYSSWLVREEKGRQEYKCTQYKSS